MHVGEVVLPASGLLWHVRHSPILFAVLKSHLQQPQMAYPQATSFDFQILKNADIVIAANSTYSFWASLLNKKAKLVFLPNYWLGFHVKSIEPKYIFNLLPDNFKIQNF